MTFLLQRVFGCLLLLFFVFSPTTLAESYAIVTSTPTPPAEKLTKTKAKLLFSGKVHTIPGIGKIELIDFPSGSEHRKEFYQKILRKSEGQMKRIWSSIAFSGRAKPPTEMKSDNIELVHQWLEQKPSAIGYLPISQTGGLNVLLEIH
ncbi:hypothetical protein [Photobacterium rosenbergii]|uniref:Phosphate ABC transporter substrate-binding protein n=1 Tax=Photobacterium rosenbergii TaxID=294936 RepID=A0ABU3ZED3_9GAMM|nr:hypothetical protein [Photobacterium rosenbergii]MDV5168446.1 hypothetical protein [Photobacterium rosenbergii]